MQAEVIRNLPNDYDSIESVISNLKTEEILEIKNRCLDDLVVYSGSLKDYESLRELLPEKNVTVIEICDKVIEAREYEQSEGNALKGRRF